VPAALERFRQRHPARVKTAADGDTVRLHVQLRRRAGADHGGWRGADERTLQAGETRDTAAGREIYLQVGNAGAVKFSINGRPAKDLGRSGETGSARITRATMERFLQ
jgi:hypothetical protein